MWFQGPSNLCSTEHRGAERRLCDYVRHAAGSQKRPQLVQSSPRDEQNRLTEVPDPFFLDETRISVGPPGIPKRIAEDEATDSAAGSVIATIDVPGHDESNHRFRTLSPGPANGCHARHYAQLSITHETITFTGGDGRK